MIKPSNYYAVIEKTTNLVAAKGTKKAMLQIIKANRGVYQLAITSRSVGAKFAE